MHTFYCSFVVHEKLNEHVWNIGCGGKFNRNAIVYWAPNKGKSSNFQVILVLIQLKIYLLHFISLDFAILDDLPEKLHYRDFVFLASIPPFKLLFKGIFQYNFIAFCLIHNLFFFIYALFVYSFVVVVNARLRFLRFVV